jgi:DMSO/TMAO reductase YedYZ molybdopterin-dependent catalytic subunit
MSSLPKNDELPLREVPPRKLAAETRRDFLLFGAGAAAAAAGLLFALPARVRHRFTGRTSWLDTLDGRRQKAMQGVLTFDDDVAEALYSPTRHVRAYTKRDVTPLRNNYNGRTPSPAYLDSWKLTISGLQSGSDAVLTRDDLHTVAPMHEQVTRLCCVEGWSAIAWWSGIRFADLLRAYPPADGMRWAALESSVNLDGRGNPDPYYVSIDLDTAKHPQALLATHHNGAPLHTDHGAPLRLVVPMKLGLKNIKAITRIAYVRDEPRDYWAERGYSRYDGL